VKHPETARIKSEDAEISKDGDKVFAGFKAPENAQPGLWPVTMTFNAKAGDWDGADIAVSGPADFAAKGNLTIVEPRRFLSCSRRNARRGRLTGTPPRRVFRHVRR